MSRDEWYRNKSWNATIASAFRAKLARSRSSRPQYLRIQASYLTIDHPITALALIDQYFETGDDFDVPNAFCVRAEAFQTLGRENDALFAYKKALEWEASHPHNISNARLDLPKIVADKRLSREYDYALDILTSRFTASEHLFPSTRYLWNGCCALITYDLGRHVEAREFAERALQAAAEIESPFRHHRNAGVVKDTSDEFGHRLKRIAKPSKLRSLFRQIART